MENYKPRLLSIVTNPNQILRKKSQEVDENKIKDENFQKILFDMKKTMKIKKGVGLAAPQIGKNLRIITVATKDNILFLINPKITKKSWSKEWEEEGCLSVPREYGKVIRHKKITCIYFDEKGQKVKIQANDFTARIIQHEIDHLDGILFIDKAKNVHTIDQY